MKGAGVVTSCLQCGEPFRGPVGGQRFCTDEHYRKWWESRRQLATITEPPEVKAYPGVDITGFRDD